MLLFLPGIDGTGSAGATQWPRLASSFEVHALSFAPADRSSFGDVLSGCEAFLGDTAAGRGTLLVGESTGAVAALGLAYRAPDAVDGLCLVNPATGYAGSALSTLFPLLPRLPRGVYRAAPFAVTPLFGKRDWFRSIVGEDATTGPPPLLPSPAAVLSASGALADALPAEALAWRLEEHLRKGSAAVNGLLAAGGRAPASSTLLLAGGRDLVLASPAETSRLQQRLPGSVRKLLPSAGHACLDDARSLNLRLELAQSGVLSAVQRAHAGRRREAAEAAERVAAEASEAEGGETPPPPPPPLPPPPPPLRPQPAAAAASVDPSPASPFEVWLQGMRRLFSPLFYSVRADGALERGVLGLALPAAGSPVLFVGNHQLFGFDGPPGRSGAARPAPPLHTPPPRCPAGLSSSKSFCASETGCCGRWSSRPCSPPSRRSLPCPTRCPARPQPSSASEPQRSPPAAYTRRAVARMRSPPLSRCRPRPAPAAGARQRGVRAPLPGRSSRGGRAKRGRRARAGAERAHPPPFRPAGLQAQGGAVSPLLGRGRRLRAAGRARQRHNRASRRCAEEAAAGRCS